MSNAKKPRPRYPSDDKPRKPSTTPQIVVKVSQELRERIEEYAASKGQTISEVVRDAADFYIDRGD